MPSIEVDNLSEDIMEVHFRVLKDITRLYGSSVLVSTIDRGYTKHIITLFKRNSFQGLTCNTTCRNALEYNRLEELLLFKSALVCIYHIV